MEPLVGFGSVENVKGSFSRDIKAFRQEGDDCAGLLTVQGVDLLLLFRPTVDLERLPAEARSAPVCFLRGKRSGDLKLAPSSYIIVSGESGEVEARARNGRFRLYRACIAAK